MRIKVKVFATLAKKVTERSGKKHIPQHLKSGDLFEVELQGGSTLDDLLDHLKLNRQEAAIIFVNARIQERNRNLAAGDQVGIFPPVGGG